MGFVNEQAALNAGQLVARRLFEARGNNSEVHLSEDDLALVAKLAFELGVQHTLKAMEAVEASEETSDPSHTAMEESEGEDNGS